MRIEWDSRQDSRRTLGVDPGEKRIGLAISDPTGVIANPLTVINHTSRLLDAAAIAGLAQEHGAVRIVVGHPLDADNRATPQSRRAYRLAAAIRMQCGLPVVLWDETGSTQAARAARLAMGAGRRERSGHLDELAATYILQSYLDAQRR
jgi:putative Holliday junction resolvase